MTSLILLALTGVIALILPVSFAAVMINLAGFLIGIAGMLLDLSLRYLVVEFGGQIYTPIADTLGNVVWATFRDFANIVIIGMFTFIAISTILGIESFGARKLIARVLIIAVLINFSLLFTRIIIESSNFVAGKFYKAMALDTTLNTTPGNDPTAGFTGFLNFASTAGVSGQFVSLLGLPSAFEARDTLNVIYDNNGGRFSWGGITAIIYGFTAAVLMLAVSAVLGYAIFLIISRTVLLLFLLVTSALAFGAFLIPKWGEKFWDMWWSSLLRSAIFAPLLMFMLWTTMTISYALVKAPGVETRSFDKLFSDPTNGSGIVALLIFLIILGMLYGSIRFASAFATTVTGFNWSAMAPAFAAGILGRISGRMAQVGIGGSSYLAAQRLQALSQNKEQPTALRKVADFGALQLMKAASQTYNTAALLNRQTQGVAGLRAANTLLGKDVKGFAGRQERKVEGITKQAERMNLSESEQKKIYGDAMATAMKENRDLALQHKETGTQVKNAEQGVKGKEDGQNKALESFQREMKAIEGKMAEAAANNDRISGDRLKAYKQQRASEHEAEMRGWAEHINIARNEVETKQKQHGEVVKKLEEIAGVTQNIETRGDLGKKLTNSFTASLEKTMGLNMMVQKREEAVAKRLGDEATNKRLREAIIPALGDNKEVIHTQISSSPQIQNHTPPSDNRRAA